MPRDPNKGPRSRKQEAGMELTEEGRRYASEGLPEKRLIGLVSGGKNSIVQLKNSLPELDIALAWSKKRGWIRIEKGRLILVKEPSGYPEQDSLKMISEGKPVPEEMLKTLESRKLVVREAPHIGEGRALHGKEVAGLTPALIKTGHWRNVRFRPYNIRATGEKAYPGKRHPYNRFLSQVRQKLVELGFREMPGHLIESEFWNFDALFQAQDHPSRDWTQTYSLRNPRTGSLPDRKIVSQVRQTHENGWKTGSTGWGYKWSPAKAAKLMPRAHTTACSARQLASGVDIPGKYFAISRCFRPDVIDATHGVEFNQTEGIVIDPSLDFRSLLGLLKQFALEMAGAEEVRFLPDYYPFTEPSCQLSARHPELGWVEFAGSGIFREELTKPLGIDEPVIAWGLGIDRLAMFRLGIKDIRELFTRNIGLLRKQRVF